MQESSKPKKLIKNQNYNFGLARNRIYVDYWYILDVSNLKKPKILRYHFYEEKIAKRIAYRLGPNYEIETGFNLLLFKLKNTTIPKAIANTNPKTQKFKVQYITWAKYSKEIYSLICKYEKDIKYKRSGRVLGK